MSDELNITEGDIITETDLNSVTEIYLNKSNVSSLKGIEYFKKLTDLYYYKNSLSSLDISMNTNLTTGIEISYIPRDLITVIFYYQISLNPLKTQSLSQVSFPLLFPLCYIVPPVFTNSDKGKYKGKKKYKTV